LSKQFLVRFLRKAAETAKEAAFLPYSVSFTLIEKITGALLSAQTPASPCAPFSPSIPYYINHPTVAVVPRS